MSTEKLRTRVSDPEITPQARQLAAAELNDRLNPQPLPPDDPETQERLEALYATMSAAKLSARAQDASIAPIARKLAREELAWRLNQASPEYTEKKTRKTEEALQENDAKRSLFAWLIGGVALIVVLMAACFVVFEQWTPFELVIYALCFLFILAMIFGKLFPRTSRLVAFLTPPLVFGVAWHYWKKAHAFPEIFFVMVLPPFFLYAAYRMYKASFDESTYSEFLTEMEEIAQEYRKEE